MDITIMLGSNSDMPVALKCTEVLERFEVDFQLRIASAHRSPRLVDEIVSKAHADGNKVFITMAGLAAALPGAVASLTTCPVIGVPCSGKVPLDSLLSMVQLPPGVPAAVVGVDNGANAAWLALQILAIADEGIAAGLADEKEKAAMRVAQMDQENRR